VPSSSPTDIHAAQSSGWLGQRAPALLAIGGLLLVCVFLWLTWITSTPVIDEIARIERSRLPRLELLHSAKSADLDASVALRNLLLVKEPRLNAAELQRYEQASRAASAAMSSFAATSTRPEEAELLRATLKARSALETVRAVAVEDDSRGGPVDADDATVRIQTALDEYLAPLQRLQEFQGAQVTSLVEEIALRASRMRILLIAAGIAAAATTVFATLARRAELRRELSEQQRRIASLHEQRDALVREVHHRIKNHLQGLLGLFEGQRLATHGREPEDALATLHGHVLALVGIHGMQAREAGECITLKDLVRQQVELVRAGFPQAQLAVTEDASMEHTTLAADASLPVALIVTELIINAIKHGAPGPIRVSLRMSEQSADVRVVNRLTRSTLLDWERGRGLGTGLNLVSTLLQGIGKLVQTTTGEELAMTLNVQFAGPPAAA
jgi:two-component sensor histidine kinase